MERTTPGALTGITVIEYCCTLSGSYCTKLMADLGAEVIHIEQPKTGDGARRMPPFPQDTPHPEKSGTFLFFNTNKLGITLDPQAPRGREIFQRLAKDADVLVEDWPPFWLELMGIGHQQLSQVNPGLITASITPFGRSGPIKDYKAYPLNIAHISGQGFVHPTPSPDLERPPTMVGGKCTDYDAGQTAAVAILAALFSKALTGKGQLVEVSKQEATLSMQKVEAVLFPNRGEVPSRKGHPNEQAVTLMLPCKDGYAIAVTPLEHQWEALLNLIGYTEWTPPSSPADYGARMKHAAVLLPRLRDWTMQHTREEVSRMAQAVSCPIAAVNSAEDVAQSAQLDARGFFGEVEHPVAGKVKMPLAPYRFSVTPATLSRPAPTLGEHNEEIYRGRLGLPAAELKELEESGVI